jgi:hypothetical protein
MFAGINKSCQLSREESVNVFMQNRVMKPTQHTRLEENASITCNAHTELTPASKEELTKWRIDKESKYSPHVKQ